MGIALTDVLLFGKAQSDDVDNATLVIYRRNILRWSALGGYLDVIVKGVSPLSLPDAVANSLQYVKAFGGTEQRNIPAEYTQVNYVTNVARTSINTGVILDSTKTYELELEASGVTGPWYALQARTSDSSAITGITGSGTGNTILLGLPDGTNIASSIARVFGNRYLIKGTLSGGQATLYVKDITNGTEDTVTGTYTQTSISSTPVYLLGNAAGQLCPIKCNVYMARIKEDGVTVMDYVPCRERTVAGFYDRATGNFMTADPTNSLSADGNTVPTPDAPMDIVSNNGVLKLSPNLFKLEPQTLNGVTLTIRDDGAYVLNGTCTTSGNFVVGLQSLGAGTYTLTIIDRDVNPGMVGTQVQAYSPSDISTNLVVKTSEGASYVTNTFGTDYNDVQFRIRIQADVVYNNYVIKPMLVKSDVVPTTYIPYGSIYADGLVETINVHGKNLFDGAIELGSINPADGSLVVSTTRTRSANFTSVQPNTTYTFTRENSDGIRWIVGYDKDKNGITDGLTDQRAAVSNVLPDNMSKTFKTTPTTHYIKWYNTSNAGLNEKVQIELGSTATEYEPYYDGGTATAEMLLKVGDYQDEQEILSGAVTRNVGAIALDGTETITGHGTIDGLVWMTNNDVLADDTAIGICSHYNFTTTGIVPMSSGNFRFAMQGSNQRIVFKDTVHASGTGTTSANNFKVYLAAQYAAGTPVIIVYPLATPTTESVAGQALQVQGGDNVLEITQASLDGLELEAQYSAAVTLTVQEVQDANLDPNVEVTIN